MSDEIATRSIQGPSSTLIGHSGIGKQTQLIGPRRRTQVEATNRRVRLTAGLGGTLNGKRYKALRQRAAAATSDSNGTELGCVTVLRIRMSVGSTFVRP
jgi:hypothetical protein